LIGLIPAAGKGKRMGLINKCMLRVNNKPIIEYSLDNLSEIVEQILIIINKYGTEIQERYQSQYKNIPIIYIYQHKEKKGIVGAIESAENYLYDDFYLSLSDEILIEPRHKEMTACFSKKDIFAICGINIVKNKERIKKTYSIKTKNNRIVKLIEKPIRVFNTYQGTGQCIFRKRFLDYISETPINPERKERDLVSVVQTAINHGETVEPFIICKEYFNVNTIKDLLDARSYFKLYQYKTFEGRNR